MAIEDVFNGAKAAFMVFDACMNTIAQEIGMERTLGLVAKASEHMGDMQSKMMKEQAGIKEFDAKAAWSLLRSAPEGYGLRVEVVEQSPKRVVVRPGRCSIYDAAQMLGIDAKTIETMCRATSWRFMDAFAKQLNPGLSFRVRKFRSAADDFCEEEVILS